MKPDLAEIIEQFKFEGDWMETALYGTGHINDTFAARFRKANGATHRYILQRINHNVFRDPEALMENIARVTGHLRKKIVASGGDPERETLNLISTLDGKNFTKTRDGNYWRAYIFIEGAQTYEVVASPDHVYNASKAFGKFQRLVSDLSAALLCETIPNFHHTRKRFEAFVEAVEKDVKNRAGSVKAEIDFMLERKAETSVIVDMLAQGAIPERVTHNDTKLNNVLIDDRTGEGICVIDLDTVMPGSALYDFGDLARVGASTAAEDEPDLSQVGVDLDMFDCLARGYLDTARDFLTPVEMDYLAFSAKLVTLEQSLRFLTDHLNGDIYYRLHRENHNLDRCRTQIKMVTEIEQKMDRMNDIVNTCRRA